ncbi:tRNA 2-selenouridine synthase [Campylobacter concisus]|uniref:tRNA 2-selenouridine synthase n=2 Tax=Campylobacter concisus TaxID=199 RepID=UPI000CD94C4D|nr:tRNA 2-selenouridine synthase [Campylobacter concisus]
MKFVAITLLLLTSIFLIACSANQASNKISNSELENLASKYGGVYVFNEKFEKEIITKEKIRREAELAIVNASKTDAEIRQNLKGFDKKYPRILSNGKKYYTRWVDYERQTGKEAKVPEIYINKIKEFIGMQDYNKHKPYIDLIKFYIESDGSIVPIVMTVDYYVKKKNYGLYGDEGRGFSLSQTTLKNISGDNKFILNNNKFEKVK